MSVERFIGIDIGGTNTRIVHSPSLETPVLEEKAVFSTTKNFEQDYQRITKYINANVPIKGVGISIPGNLNEDRSMVSYAIHIPAYMNRPLPALLRERYNCEIRMDNDAAVAALGEAFYGTIDKSDFTYIIWGTGVGGATVVYQDDTTNSAPLDWKRYLQTWDEICGGNSLRKKYGKPAEQLSDWEWREVMKFFSGELLSFVDKLQPRRIIFGGGIAMKQAIGLINLVDQLHGRFPHKLPLIEISKLGEDAGLYGALGLLKGA